MEWRLTCLLRIDVMAFLLNDLRYSVRSFLRTPGSTIALVGSIALGVGSNAAVHGFANGLNRRQSPLTTQDRVVSFFHRDAQRSAAAFSYDDFLSLKNRPELFEWIGAVRETRASLVHHGQSVVVSVASATPEIAALFNFSLRDGSVISYRLWQTEFNGQSGVSGTRIRVDDVMERVTGIAPDWLDGLFAGSAVDIWTAWRDETLETTDRTSRNYWVLARLRAGVSLTHLHAVLNTGGDGSNEIAVARYTGMTPETMDGMSRINGLLALASAAVFFIACANVAAFMLGRATARSRETSVRVALGASRRRLAGQLLSDSVLIALVGGGFGLLLAVWTADAVPALFFTEDAEHLVFAPDTTRILLTAAACVAVTVLCGLLPLLETRDDRPAAVLQRESSGPSIRTGRLRALLVIGQMACCFMLVVSTGFLLHGFRWSLQTALGRNLENALLAIVHASHGAGLRYFEEIEAAASSYGGISESAWVGRLPGSRPVWEAVRIVPATSPQRDVTIRIEAFTPDSLSLVTLPPVSGRMFAGRDTPHTCRVAIVNPEAAEELFGGDAVGRVVQDEASQRVEIVGVVATRTTHPESRAVPTLYYYSTQRGAPYDWVGQSRFRVATTQKLSTAVLDAHVVSPDYFRMIGVPSTAGRLFSGRQGSAECRVAVVNQEAADRYFGGSAVGAAVIDTEGRRTEIIGVVQSAALQVFQRAGEPAIYYPMAEDFTPRMTLILRAAQVSDDVLRTLQQRLQLIPGGREQPVVKALEAHLRQTALAPLRIVTVLVSTFSIIALTLAVLGLYSALSDSARQRRREIALRIVLGAQGWRVIQHVIGEGGRLAAAGTALGILLSAAAVRFLAQMAPGDVPVNVWTWLAAPLMLLGAVLVASVVPAIRALAVDPLVITRE